MKKPIPTRDTTPPNRHRRFVVLASVTALTTVGMLWFSLNQVGSGKLPTRTSQAKVKKSPRAESSPADAETRRLEELAERGANAFPVGNPDPGGPAVPALVPERELISSGWQADPDPALADFAHWTKTYLAADIANRPALEKEGADIAAARLRVLEGMIAKDPRRALANAVPLAVREQLPASLQEKLEERVDGFGDLYTLHTTPQPDGKGTPNFDYASVGDQSFEAYRYGARTSVPYIKDVSLHGIAVGNRLAVLDSPLRTLETGERVEGKFLNQFCPVSNLSVAATGSGIVESGAKTTFQVGTDLYGTCEPAHVANVESAIVSVEKSGDKTGQILTNHDLQRLYVQRISALGDSGVSGGTGYIGLPPNSVTQGGKNILIMRVQPTDKPFPGWATDATFSDTVWRADGWNTRTKRCSYNKAWINRADITPVMNLPQNSAYYTGNGYDWGRWSNDAKAAAAARGYNLNDYACFVIAHENYNQFGAAGWGGGGTIWCNGNFDVRLFVHEYGHVFWLPHANSWTATDGNPISNGRTHVEYGDANDPMGNAWGANQYNTYSAYFKNFCGWLPNNAVQTVTRNGTYRVYQDDGATALNRTLALKLGRNNEFNYWLSIRGDAVAQANFTNGVSVMAVSSWRTSDSHLLDINNPGDNNRDNAPLALNQTWYDANADLTIKTVAVGGTNPNRYADVQVTFGPRNTGAYRPLVSGGVYRLRNRNNSKYLDVPNNSAAEGTPVQVYAATNSAAQNWVVWRNADESYSFNHQGTNQWLEVANNGLADGNDIRQWGGNGSDAQKWYVSQNVDGYLVLAHKGTDGKVIDMATGGANDVAQWGYGGNNWQEWYPELVGMSAGTYRLLPRHAQGQCLDIDGTNTNDGQAAQLWQWVANGNQKFTLSSLDSGRIRLTPTTATGRALDVNANSNVNGTKIQQWTWNNSGAQRWTFARTDGNWLRFTPDCAPAGCMEVSGDDNQFGNASRVQLWQYTGAQDQQWRFSDSN